MDCEGAAAEDASEYAAFAGGVHSRRFAREVGSRTATSSLLRMHGVLVHA